MLKRCRGKCKKVLSIDEFARQKNTYTGKIYTRTVCKSCIKIPKSRSSKFRYEQLKEENPDFLLLSSVKRYNITIEDYKKLLADQNEVCAVCKEECKKHTRLSIDHDHKTGKVRGLLCSRCNLILGKFDDRADLFINAAEYIKKHQF